MVFRIDSVLSLDKFKCQQQYTLIFAWKPTLNILLRFFLIFNLHFRRERPASKVDTPFQQEILDPPLRQLIQLNWLVLEIRNYILTDHFGKFWILHC